MRSLSNLVLKSSFSAVLLSVGTPTAPAFAQVDKPTKTEKAETALLTATSPSASRRFEITVEPDGPDSAELAKLESKIMARPDVVERLKGSRYRVLAAEIVQAPDASKDAAEYILNERFEVQVYDYTHDRLLTISSYLNELREEPVSLISEESDVQPNPTDDEFADAVEILRRHTGLGRDVMSGRLKPYQAMPQILDPQVADGQGNERIIPVGLRPTTPGVKHEIVAVNLSTGRVTRYENMAPPGALALAPVCGPISAGQRSTRKGVAGSATITVKRDGQTLWSFRVVRPSASSGRNGSGVEVRTVSYKGRKVLNRAHVPILNVDYDQNACGPYRDWQYAENPFRAEGTTRAPGILMASSKPRTIIDSNSDSGNFRGVAIYTDGPETVLMSELSAGWYRYVSEWRFHEDGTIKPVWKFSAVHNSCTCRTHNHHAYWRFDFDVDGAASNTVEVLRDGAWRSVSTESKFMRNFSNRAWRVSNSSTGHRYEITPGANDGTANSYGEGDVWALAYRSSELDDSSVRRSTRAALDSFLTGQSLENKDVVLWYGVHFRHVNGEEHTMGPGIAGPTIRPVR